MADGIDIKVDTTDLKAVFDNLATKQRDKIIRTALKKAAEVERAAIAYAAPEKVGKGGILPDGALRNDITTRMGKDEQGNLIAIVGPGKYTRQVANWVEYGHRIVTGGYLKLLKNGKKRGPGEESGTVEPHPFIRPTAEAIQNEVTDTLANTLAEEITKAASSVKGN
jgi:HK97 gp10 family phage protein